MAKSCKIMHHSGSLIKSWLLIGDPLRLKSRLKIMTKLEKNE